MVMVTGSNRWADRGIDGGVSQRREGTVPVVLRAELRVSAVASMVITVMGT